MSIFSNTTSFFPVIWLPQTQAASSSALRERLRRNGGLLPKPCNVDRKPTLATVTHFNLQTVQQKAAEEKKGFSALWLDLNWHCCEKCARALVIDFIGF
jgi:hypothetical protein